MQKWLRRSIGLAVAGLLGFYPLLAPPAHRIDQQHFERIQVGMTLAEVESIFGQPPGNYDWAVANGADSWLLDFALSRLAFNLTDASPRIVVADFDGDGWADVYVAATSRLGKNQIINTVVGYHHSANVEIWASRHGACSIWFYENGRVARKSNWGDSRVEPPWSKWWKKCFGH